MKKIILASGSPRRKMLLDWAELKFDVQVSDAEESYPGDLKPDEVATYIAIKKNNAVFNQFLPDQINESIVISADTIVVLDNEIIGKPVDREDAIAILERLSANRHSVITAVYIRSANVEISFTETTIVYFHHITSEQIQHYVDIYKPYDKAGAYAIQEWIGVIGIEKIEGDFYNVMGLPVSRVLKCLKENFS